MVNLALAITCARMVCCYRFVPGNEPEQIDVNNDWMMDKPDEQIRFREMLINPGFIFDEEPAKFRNSIRLVYAQAAGNQQMQTGKEDA